MNTPNSVVKADRNRDLALPNKMPGAFENIIHPPTSVGSLILFVFVLGFGMSGTIEVEGDLQVVDHLEGGVISEIFVSEGQTVEAGDVLLQLDAERVIAQRGMLQNQLANSLARRARVAAEAAQAEKISFETELLDLVRSYPDFQLILDAQERLFASNLQSDNGERSIFLERISQLEGQLKGYDDRGAALNAQLQLVRDDLSVLQELQSKGLTRGARVIARQEDEVVLMGRLSQVESDRQSALQQIAEVKQRGLQINRQRRSTIAQEQQIVTQEIYDLRQRLLAMDTMVDRLTVTAPMSGTVVGFDLNTVGASISSGEEIMRIVPRGKGMIIEAQIATSDVDEVTVGQEARIRLSAYSFRKTPPISGQVTYVSGDSFYNTPTSSEFFRIKVSLSQEELADLPQIQIQPGMPVQVMVSTTEQTIMSYLLDPVLGGLETAMVEGE
jgi:HlyD family type I secretion membrane fusion protein